MSFSELSDAAMQIVIKSVEAVRALPLHSVSEKGQSLLKPGYLAANADIEGENTAFEVMQSLSDSMGCEFRVIIDADLGTFHSIGKGEKVVWSYLDAVDGTLKVAGLGNEMDGPVKKIRIVNDGSFASAVAFTLPGNRLIEDLTVGDFVVTAIADAAMRSKAGDSPGLFPRGCIAVKDGQDGNFVTRSFGLEANLLRPLHTSTSTKLQQSFVFFDAFQAFDRASAKPGDEELAVSLFQLAINRNEGGAFDLLRSYGSLSAILRNMVSDHQKEGNLWIEAQCSGFLCVNENLPNLIPVVPLLIGCGAICSDFEGNDLIHRRLIDGRTSVVYAANRDIHHALVELVNKAKAREQRRG